MRRDDLVRGLALELGARGRFTAADVWAAWLGVTTAADVGRRRSAMCEIRAVLADLEGWGKLTSVLEPDERGTVRRYYERIG